jgi:hypothetical protein
MASKLTERDHSFLALIQRSPDIGGGWRKVSPHLWALIGGFKHAELIEKDEECSRIRLTEAGQLIVRYL